MKRVILQEETNLHKKIIIKDNQGTIYIKKNLRKKIKKLLKKMTVETSESFSSDLEKFLDWCINNIEKLIVASKSPEN